MYSIIKGIDRLVEKTIIAYSDIIFDQELITKMLKKEADIILSVDGTYKKTHLRNKELELVVTERPPSDGVRTLDAGRNNRILKIGKHLCESEACYEFVGLACFSQKGLNILKTEYRKAKNSASFSFTDFIQYLIKKGYNVLSYEISGGWMEVHNFNDYKRACAIFS